jgi:hypothetical protein
MNSATRKKGPRSRTPQPSGIEWCPRVAMNVRARPMIAIPVAINLGSVAMISRQCEFLSCNRRAHGLPMIEIPGADDCRPLHIATIRPRTTHDRTGRAGSCRAAGGAPLAQMVAACIASAYVVCCLTWECLTLARALKTLLQPNRPDAAALRNQAATADLSMPPAVMPNDGSEVVNLRLKSRLVDELDAAANAERTTRKVIITRALARAGYHVPADDLLDRTPKKRRRGAAA